MNAIAVTETYNDVENLIFWICNKFTKQFGADFEECVSIGNLVFMDVYKMEIKESVGTFQTLLTRSIWNRLLSEADYQKRRKMVSLDVEDKVGNTAASAIPDHVHSDFDMQACLAEMSSDAAYVFKLVTEAPAEIAAAVEAKGGHAHNWRAAVKSHLAKIGWSISKIQQSFEEISTILRS